MMSNRFLSAIAGMVFAVLTLSAIPALAQSKNAPDMNGLWDGARNSSNLVQAMKPEQIPFTAFGLQKYRNVDMSTNPNGQCLPPGPSRSITGPSPFQIVQSPATVAILFENHFDYRLIYTDGTQHPKDIADYPAFMGHSVGKWEGDTLVVDTVGINDRTWLDSNGLQHSDKLRLSEKFQKTGPETIQYSVTYDDPVYFTKAWTFNLQLKRLKKEDRIMEYVCEENEKDFKTLRPTPRSGSDAH